MTFLPIVARELRVASRRRYTYWMRAGAAAGTIFVGFFCFVVFPHPSPQEIAKALFYTLTAGALLYCLAGGIFFTADCLSEEKREGTLGLLFLTDLRGYDVILGKMAATSFSASYGALAVIPMLAVPLLLGGLTPGEFARTAIVAVNTLFFSLAVGVCMSALSRSERKARAITCLVILFLTAVMPAIGAWFAYLRKMNAIPAFWLAPSAGFSYRMAFDSEYKSAPHLFFNSLISIHLLGWIFLGLASIVVRFTWQDRPPGVQALRWRDRWRLWSYGDVAERSTFRRELLEQSPFFWLAARDRLKPAYVWAALGLVACFWVWGLAKSRSDFLNEGMYVVTALGLNLILKIWFVSEAGRQLAEDHKHGGLELILSTPLSIREILHGQWLALQRQFLGPLLVVLFTDLVFLVTTLIDNVVDTERAFWLALWVSGMAMLVADLVALYWVGSWQALVARNANRAARATFLRILVLPWLLVALIILLLSINPGTLSEATWKLFLGVWFGAGLAADFFFGSLARRNLLENFRRAAEQKYDAGQNFWKRFLRRPETGKVPLSSVVALQK